MPQGRAAARPPSPLRTSSRRSGTPATSPRPTARAPARCRPPSAPGSSPRPTPPRAPSPLRCRDRRRARCCPRGWPPRRRRSRGRTWSAARRSCPGCSTPRTTAASSPPSWSLRWTTRSCFVRPVISRASRLENLAAGVAEEELRAAAVVGAADGQELVVDGDALFHRVPRDVGDEVEARGGAEEPLRDEEPLDHRLLRFGHQRGEGGGVGGVTVGGRDDGPHWPCCRPRRDSVAAALIRPSRCTARSRAAPRASYALRETPSTGSRPRTCTPRAWEPR